MSPYDPSRLIRKQVLRIFYPPKADLPDQKVYVEFDADGEIVAMRDEIRILREALERIAKKEQGECYATGNEVADAFAVQCALRSCGAIARAALAKVEAVE